MGFLIKKWDFVNFTFSMSFNDLNDQFQALADKYGLTPGVQGDYDLRSIFGDLVDDQSFVRDRVSHYDLIILVQ